MVDSDTLRMFHTRFQSLLSLFEGQPDFPLSRTTCDCLLRVVNFCTLIGLYSKGFMVLVEHPFSSSSSSIVYKGRARSLFETMSKNTVGELSVCNPHKEN